MSEQERKLEKARRVLGLDVGASRAEVKRVHRRLTLAQHPDRGSARASAATEAKRTEFQSELNDARDVLLAHIDRLDISTAAETGADNSEHARTSRPPASEPARAPAPARPTAPPGRDEYREVTFDFLTTLRGGPTRVGLPTLLGGMDDVIVQVPQGVELGTLLCVVGAGEAGEPPGDLFLRVAGIESDPTWRIAEHREGRPIDLVTSLSVTLAALYAERLVPVRSPWTNTIGLPLRWPNFGPYSIRGHGVRRRVGGREVAGDLLVHLDIIWPPRGRADLSFLLSQLQG